MKNKSRISFDHCMSLGCVSKGDHPLNGFVVYPVKFEDDSKQLGKRHVIRVENEDEAEAFGLYLGKQTEDGAEEEWIADFPTKGLAYRMMGMFINVVTASRIGYTADDESFAGWIAQDVLDAAENDELELSEEEAREVLKWMLNHCDAGRGVGIEQIDEAIRDYLQDKYSVEMSWGYTFDQICSYRSLHYSSRMCLIPPHFLFFHKIKGDAIWVIDPVKGDANIFTEGKNKRKEVEAMIASGDYLFARDEPVGELVGYQIVDKKDMSEYPSGYSSEEVMTKPQADAIKRNFNIPEAWTIIPAYSNEIRHYRKIQ